MRRYVLQAQELEDYGCFIFDNIKKGEAVYYLYISGAGVTIRDTKTNVCTSSFDEVTVS